MNVWDKFKEINEFNLREVVLPPGYVFDKHIFRVGIALIFVWLLLAASELGFVLGTNVYINCPMLEPHTPVGSKPCVNPFYAPVFSNPICLKYGICDKEFLFPGESYGSPPGFFYSQASNFALLVFVSMILLNHFLFNRHFFVGGKKHEA
jgi:hypothetical protein